MRRISRERIQEEELENTTQGGLADVSGIAFINTISFKVIFISFADYLEVKYDGIFSRHQFRQEFHSLFHPCLGNVRSWMLDCGGKVCPIFAGTSSCLVMTRLAVLEQGKWNAEYRERRSEWVCTYFLLQRVVQDWVQRSLFEIGCGEFVKVFVAESK